MRFLISCFLICILLQQVLFAQQPTPENKRIDSINNLSFSFAETDAQKAMYFAQQAKALSESENYPNGIAKAYNNMGIVYDIKGDYDSSLYYYSKGYEIADASKILKTKGSIINNMGMIFWNKGEYDAALKKYFEAEKIFTEINEPKLKANTLSNIGLIYYDINKYKESYDYCFSALKIREQIKDEYGMSVSYNNMGNLYSKMGNSKMSIEYIEKSIVIKKKQGDDYGLAIDYTNLATEYNKLKKMEDAMYWNNEAIKIRLKIDDKFGLCTSYINLSHNYIDLNDFTNSKYYLQNAETLALELDSKSKLQEVYKTYSDVFKVNANYDSAYFYLEKSAQLKDSIFTEESNKQFAQLHVQYETAKKENEIAQQKLSINRRNTLLALLAAVLFFSLILFIVLYKNYRIKQEKKLQVELLKEQEKRAQAILDSEENERQRLARELHDGVGQLLSATRLNLSNVNTENQESQIRQSISVLDESIQEIRTLSHNMVPDVLHQFGLEKAVTIFANKMQSTATEIQVFFSGYQENMLDDISKLMLYRIIQECVNNAVKYASATQITLQITADEKEITLMVEDNGIGFDKEIISSKNGIGMKNLELRSAYLKGHLDIESSLGNGTTIIVDIPIKQ